MLIPAPLVDYFLLGKTRPDALERFTQDGGVVSDVWQAFAADSEGSHRVIIEPARGVTTGELGFALHEAIKHYRSWGYASNSSPTTVVPYENFVLATVSLEELTRVVLPTTTWWHQRGLTFLKEKAMQSEETFESTLHRAIMARLKKGMAITASDVEVRNTSELFRGRVAASAPIAALIGLFYLRQPVFEPLLRENERSPAYASIMQDWIEEFSELIAGAATEELGRRIDWPRSLAGIGKRYGPPEFQFEHIPPELVQRVFLNRSGSLADLEGNRAVKADAAIRVFGVTCERMAWAIIDSGIEAEHPAFRKIDQDGRVVISQSGKPESRIKAGYDFTLINRVKSYDLMDQIDESLDTLAQETSARIIAVELQKDLKFDPTAEWFSLAEQNLILIAKQLRRRVQPDWGLIEPLIRVREGSAKPLPSSHGTHVAGILGANWIEADDASGERRVRLQGICPDISLYDFRVIKPGSLATTEDAVLAAIEFAQYLNQSAGANGPVIHGVNLSLSIPHDVRNYGCGATPVCVACDKLSNSGVVVVAAAGNRGWNQMEYGFGNFVFCSITDPGNSQAAITVGATHGFKPHTYGVSYFSSRGPTGDGRAKPDLVAPGERIRGPIGKASEDELDGTSMAAPFVSGAAALIMARNPELIGNAARIKSILCSTATDLGRERYFQGHGLLDVLRALQAI